MFYNNCEMGFIIRGVYRVKGEPKRVVEKGRSHTAISYRIKGNTAIFCDGGRLSLSNGTVTFFPAGADYIRETYDTEEYIVAHLDAFGSTEKTVETVENAELTEPFFETLLSEWESGNYNRCIRSLYRIFDKLGEDKIKKAALPQVISPGVEHMRRCFRDGDLTVAYLAELCHVSETYFRRVYGERFGISPHEALLNHRFEYARDLLSSGYYQTKDVAIMSGFSDVKYFRTAFKKRYGITVGEYLKDGERAVRR